MNTRIEVTGFYTALARDIIEMRRAITIHGCSPNGVVSIECVICKHTHGEMGKVYLTHSARIGHNRCRGGISSTGCWEGAVLRGIHSRSTWTKEGRIATVTKNQVVLSNSACIRSIACPERCIVLIVLDRAVGVTLVVEHIRWIARCQASR